MLIRLLDDFACGRVEFDNNLNGSVARDNEFHRLRQAIVDRLMHGVRRNVYEVALRYVQRFFEALAREEAPFAAHNVDCGLAIDMVMRAGGTRRWDGRDCKVYAFRAGQGFRYARQPCHAA